MVNDKYTNDVYMSDQFLKRAVIFIGVLMSQDQRHRQTVLMHCSRRRLGVNL